MSLLLNAIVKHADQRPDEIAIEGDNTRLSYQALRSEVEQLAIWLQQQRFSSLALLMDNDPAWVVIDLATQAAGITLVPLPRFFSAQQMQHALKDAAVEAIISDENLNNIVSTNSQPINKIAGQNCWLTIQTDVSATPRLKNIAKVTYTSGTTGNPKGVCLTQAVMENVANSLSEAIHADEKDRHLCLLPLAVLLENIGGIYAPLISGGRCIIPSLARVGMQGAAGLAPETMVKAMIEAKASSVIMLPQMLQALVTTLKKGLPRPGQLRFIAVGGAPLSVRLLRASADLGLPLFEGYGLSECASVVAVNTPENHRPGSVGKLLPQTQLKFADDGEILLRGNLFSGYLNHEYQAADWYASGDLGYLDDEGFLFLTGRKKSCFITSFGRNVAPEWVEKELTQHPVIAQAAVFGEARPFNVAIIAAVENSSEQQIAAAVKQANQILPDYARVSAWLTAHEPFGQHNQQLTANGRPRRNAIWAAYGDQINQRYKRS